MPIRVSSVCLAALVLLTGLGVSSPWDNVDLLNASAVGGNNATLNTDLISHISVSHPLQGVVPTITKNVNAVLDAKNVHSVALSSETQLTRQIDGHTYTTGSQISETWTLPGNSKVVLNQTHTTDSIDPQNPQTDFNTTMWTDDPEFNDLMENRSLDNMMKTFFGEQIPDNKAIQSIVNLGYSGNRDVTGSESAEGMTRSWGISQKTITNYNKLASLK